MSRFEIERVDTIVVGGGQAGLAVGYHLARRRLPFVILDAHPRVGDAWRTRWDNLRLFTPAGYDGLPGMRFPAPRTTYPTKDEMADYLEAYAQRFDLPVRTGVRVDALASSDDRFTLAAGDLRFEASNVVVAMSSDLVPRTPDFASQLAPHIRQLHSYSYRNPSQLQDGDVLIVGGGNSGADIAMDIAPSHSTLLSGRDVGHIPFPVNRFVAGTVYHVFRFRFHHLLKADTRAGRKMMQDFREGHGLPLVRVKPRHLTRAGVQRVSRTIGVKDGRPVLEDDRVLDVANVVWCTGFRPDFSWIHLPVFDGDEEPRHTRGVVESRPGLYFVGLDFLYAASSAQINGVGRDAGHVVSIIAEHAVDRHGAKTLGGI